MKSCKFCNVKLTEANSCPSDWINSYNICKFCRNLNSKRREAKIRNNKEVLNLIISENHCCIECNHILTKENWAINNIARHRYLCNSCKNLESKKQRELFKIEIISEYGGRCACCGETESIFLNIDHIDNNGSSHRKELSKKTGLKMTGSNFYRWLKKQGYPKDNYQILCFNCNFAKHVLGKCPHQQNI